MKEKKRVYKAVALILGLTIINIGYEKIISDSGLLYVLVVFTSLGLCITSKLFMNVREKLSLCYYVYSRLDRLKGIMTVFTGCDRESFKKAYDEIWDYFADPSFLEEVPAIYAEMMGLDVY